jgi:hypothetical protein
MDTLSAAQELKRAGFSQDQADAISRVIYDLGRDKYPRPADLVTKYRLDVRLLQHTLAIVVFFAIVVGLDRMLG